MLAFTAMAALVASERLPDRYGVPMKMAPSRKVDNGNDEQKADPGRVSEKGL